MKWCRVFAPAIAVLLLTACAGTPEGPLLSASGDSSAGRPRKNATVDTYRIGVDDRIQVAVWRNPELSVTVPVRPDGMISVPIIGDVEAGGLTAEEVAARVKAKLSTYIRDPTVAVVVMELRSHEFLSRVRVTGAVRTPKSLPYRQGMTVLDAVLEAGGLNDFAAPGRTKLYRKTGSKTDIVEIELDRILMKGDLRTNLEVAPGDVITVPERLF